MIPIGEVVAVSLTENKFNFLRSKMVRSDVRVHCLKAKVWCYGSVYFLLSRGLYSASLMHVFPGTEDSARPSRVGCIVFQS